MAVIKNATFESGTDQTASWFNSTVVRSTTDAHSGVASLLCTTTASFSGVELTNHPYYPGVTGGQDYDFSLWYRESTATMPTVTWTIYWYDSSAVRIRSDPITMPRSQAWAQVSATLTAPAGAVSVGWTWEWNSSSKPAFRLDDILVQDAAAAVAALVVNDARSVAGGITSPMIAQSATTTVADTRTATAIPAVTVEQGGFLTTAGIRSAAGTAAVSLVATATLLVTPVRASARALRPGVAQFVGAATVAAVRATAAITPTASIAQAHSIDVGDIRSTVGCATVTPSQAQPITVNPNRTGFTTEATSVTQRHDLSVSGLRAGTAASKVILSGIRPARSTATATRSTLTQHTAVPGVLSARAGASTGAVPVWQAHPPLTVQAPAAITSSATGPAVGQSAAVSVAPTRSGIAATAVPLIQNAVLTVHAARTPTTVTGAGQVVQSTAVTAGDSRAASAASPIALAQAGTLTATDVRFGAAATEPAVAQRHPAIPRDARSTARARRAQVGGTGMPIVRTARAASAAAVPLLVQRTPVAPAATGAATRVVVVSVGQVGSFTVASVSTAARVSAPRLDPLAVMTLRSSRSVTRTIRAALVFTVGKPVRVPTAVLVPDRFGTASVPDRGADADTDRPRVRYPPT